MTVDDTLAGLGARVLGAYLQALFLTITFRLLGKWFKWIDAPYQSWIFASLCGAAAGLVIDWLMASSGLTAGFPLMLIGMALKILAITLCVKFLVYDVRGTSPDTAAAFKASILAYFVSGALWAIFFALFFGYFSLRYD
jgi:hypothetical protein